MLSENRRAIVSRLDKQGIGAIREADPKDAILEVNDKIGMLVIKKKNFRVKKSGGKIGLLTAGTSDIRVAEEARIVAEEIGCQVLSAYDVGVARIHRLFVHLTGMIEKEVNSIIVVAGWELCPSS
jgi:NCAIR mutase (PurE)-related protein